VRGIGVEPMIAASGPDGVSGLMNAAFGLRAAFLAGAFFGAAFLAGAFFAVFFAAFFVAIKFSSNEFAMHSDSVLDFDCRESALVA